jgi:hypothetical protein
LETFQDCNGSALIICSEDQQFQICFEVQMMMHNLKKAKKAAKKVESTNTFKGLRSIHRGVFFDEGIS